METWNLSLENLSLNRSVGTREPFSAAFICEINFSSWKAPVKVIDPPALSGWGWWRRGNKRGVMGRWRSGHRGCFNLPDASRWQRLITRWHGGVMFTLSHLFNGGVGWAGGARASSLIQCHLSSLWSRCFWKRGTLSPFMRSPAASLRVLHRPGQSRRAERRVLVGCWWVGYNSSPERDGALSQSLHRPASPLLCAEKGFSASLLCEL